LAIRNVEIFEDFWKLHKLQYAEMKQIGFGKFIKNPRRNQDCNDITTRDESLFFDLISTRTSLFHGQIQFELRQDAFKHIARDEIRRVSEKRNFHSNYSFHQKMHMSANVIHSFRFFILHNGMPLSARADNWSKPQKNKCVQCFVTKELITDKE